MFSEWNSISQASPLLPFPSGQSNLLSGYAEGGIM